MLDEESGVWTARAVLFTDAAGRVSIRLHVELPDEQAADPSLCHEDQWAIHAPVQPATYLGLTPCVGNEGP